MARKLLVLNWKMAPEKFSDAQTLFAGTKRLSRGSKNAGLVVCPPAVFLGALRRGYDGSVLFGAQDVFWESTGAHTGSISPHMLRDLSVRYVIVGHSERRALGETDEIVAHKTRAVLSAGLSPIVCIGEAHRDEKGHHFHFLAEQLTQSLKGVGKARAKDVIIAYEPLWAIGKTHDAAMDPHSLHEMTLFIRKVLTKMFGRNVGLKMRVLYGGSVEEENAESLVRGTGVDGFLIGHASLDLAQLRGIVRALS